MTKITLLIFVMVFAYVRADPMSVDPTTTTNQPVPIGKFVEVRSGWQQMLQNEETAKQAAFDRLEPKFKSENFILKTQNIKESTTTKLPLILDSDTGNNHITTEDSDETNEIPVESVTTLPPYPKYDLAAANNQPNSTNSTAPVIRVVHYIMFFITNQGNETTNLNITNRDIGTTTNGTEINTGNTIGTTAETDNQPQQPNDNQNQIEFVESNEDSEPKSKSPILNLLKFALKAEAGLLRRTTSLLPKFGPFAQLDSNQADQQSTR